MRHLQILTAGVFALGLCYVHANDCIDAREGCQSSKHALGIILADDDTGYDDTSPAAQGDSTMPSGDTPAKKAMKNNQPGNDSDTSSDDTEDLNNDGDNGYSDQSDSDS